MNCLFWPSASKDEFLSLSQMFKLLLWASRQVRARVQTYNTFIQVLQVIMYHEGAVSHCDNVTIQYQPINCCSTLLCKTRSDSMAICVLPQIYWKLLPQLAHTRQVDLTSSVSVFNRSIDFYLLNMSSSLSHFRPRVCIGRTSGLVCDGVSDCIFGEDEDPQLCQTSSSHKAVPERK